MTVLHYVRHVQTRGRANIEFPNPGERTMNAASHQYAIVRGMSITIIRENYHRPKESIITSASLYSHMHTCMSEKDLVHVTFSCLCV